MMLNTGNQLKAARALCGVDQIALAEKAKVNVGTIRKMEARGSEKLTSGLETIHKIQTALETAGIEFLNHGQPGVRLIGKSD